MKLLSDVRDVRAILAFMVIGAVIAAVFVGRLDAQYIAGPAAVIVGYLFRASQERSN